VEELLEGAKESAPWCEVEAVEGASFGVRAQPRRSSLGALPVVRRQGSRWDVLGLGARGLVYHAALGEWVAAAALSRDTSNIPSELLYT